VSRSRSCKAAPLNVLCRFPRISLNSSSCRAFLARAPLQPSSSSDTGSWTETLCRTLWISKSQHRESPHRHLYIRLLHPCRLHRQRSTDLRHPLIATSHRGCYTACKERPNHLRLACGKILEEVLWCTAAICAQAHIDREKEMNLFLLFSPDIRTLYRAFTWLSPNVSRAASCC